MLLSLDNFNQNLKRFKNKKKIFSGWMLFCALIFGLLLFFHAELLSLIGFGIVSILPFGFLFFQNNQKINIVDIKNDKIKNDIPTQKLTQSTTNEKNLENELLAKHKTTKSDIKKEKITKDVTFLNDETTPNLKDLHTDRFNEALNSGVIVKSVELEKIATKNNIKLPTLMGMNSWLFDRLSFDKETVLLVDGEKITVSDKKEIIVDINEILQTTSSENVDLNGELSQNIQDELNISSEELEQISKDTALDYNNNKIEKNLVDNNQLNMNLHKI